MSVGLSHRDKTRPWYRRVAFCLHNGKERIAFAVGLTQGETLSLALLLQRPATLEARLLLFQLLALALELVLHLAMTSVQLLLTLLELGFLLGDLLLEHELHLGLHLGELLVVQGTLLLLLHSRVDLLEHARILRDTHLQQLVGAVVLVENVVGVLLELLHVRADKHLPQLDEVTVLLVIDLNDTPWVATATDLTAISVGDLVSRTNNSKGNLGQDLVVLGNRLLVVKLVTGALEDLDLVVLDVGENLQVVRGRLKAYKRIMGKQLTRRLKAVISSSVRVSDLAMTGIRLTLVCRRFMTSMSRGFRE